MRVYSLMYHDVVHPNAVDASGFAGAAAASYKVDADRFERQLTAITEAVTRAQLDRVTTPRELALRTSSQRPAALLHFDDGGASALAVADRLERAGWRGFFHVTTDRIGTPGFVAEADVRELHARGHVIGSHSCSHPSRMSALPSDALAREWTASKARLDDLVGEPIVVASVPGGYGSHAVAIAAARAGIEVLFTSEPTSKPATVDGCLVLGRYAIRRHTRPDVAARLAVGAPFPCWEQWVGWNAKKVVKRFGGKPWLVLREHLLAWQGPRTRE